MVGRMEFQNGLTGNQIRELGSFEFVAHRLHENRDRIVRLWEKRTRRVSSAAQRLNSSELIDSLPRFLNQLIELLEAHGDGLEARGMSQTGEMHGAERFLHDEYTLSQVIDEYRVLREIIFEVLEEEGLLMPGARDVILSALDKSMGHAVSAYSQAEVVYQNELLDATERSRIDADQQRAAIDALVEGSPIGIALLDRELRYVRVNEVIARLNGRAPEDHVGKTVSEVLPAVADQIVPVLKGVLETGVPVLNLESKAEAPGDNRRTHFFLSNYFPVRSHDDQIIGLGGAVVDITRQKAIENQLRATEEFKTRLIESSDDCFKVLDLKGHLIFLHEASARHLELESPELVVGKCWIDFWPRPEDRAAAKKAVEAALNGKRGEMIGFYPTPSGRRQWWHVVVTPMYNDRKKPESLLAVSRDITEDRLIQQEALELARLLDLTHEAVVIRDENDRVIYWNDGATLIYGFTREEALGRTTHQLLKTEFSEALDQIYARLRRDGFWNGELTHTRKDGDKIIVLSRWVLDTKSGGAVRILETNSNITHMKAAIDALKQSESQFRAIFELAASGKIVVDTETGRILRANKKFREMLGYSEEELEQKTFMDVTYPEDREWQQSQYMEKLTRGEAWTLEKRYVRKDGGVIWALISAAILEKKDGLPAKTISTIVDITKRKEIEKELEHSRQRFQMLAEAAPQIVWLSDPSGNAEYVNSQWTDYTGLSFEESLGAGWWAAVHPDDVAKWPYPFPANTDLVTFEERKRGKDGIYRWHLDRIVPIKDSNGKVVRLIGTATDIEAQKNIQQELEAERSLRERFTNALAHDLRTPLGIAKMSVQLALRKQDPVESGGLLHKSIESLQRADRMITDLLDANRINAREKIPIELTFCDLRDVVQTAIDEMGVVHGRRFDLIADEPVPGNWGRDAIRRVIDNLLSNAVKYGSPHAPITVTLRRSSDQVSLSVHNLGNPIPPTDRDNLFQLFRRAGQAEASGQKGWGIGLTLVKGIAEAHGGTVQVESSAGAGTTFTVVLPIRHDEGRA